MERIKNLFSLTNSKQSDLDKAMHRRSYEKHLEEVKMPHHYTGFTNRILVQQPDDKTINYFIPVYIIFKIKSLQEIDIQKLMGSISCVIIINIQIQNLPDEIVHLLETGMNIQLNRSELVQLKQSQEHNISVSKKDKFLSFTLRKTVTGTIMEDTLWSPFEIIRLIVSITFNSIKKDGEEIAFSYLQKQVSEKRLNSERVQNIIKQLGKIFIPPKVSQAKKKQKKLEIEFDSLKKYNISFNCMRNGGQIPISYALGCVYSLYDLAQRKLESYHTHLDSYIQIIRKYEGQQKSTKKQKKQEKKIKSVQDSKVQTKESLQQEISQLQLEHHDSIATIGQYLKQIFTDSNENKEKKGLPKAKYYQFSHFVIPLYKYPGNSLATIFIPIFLLALLSLTIFYQDNQLSSRIASIATMVLGYIALIPSIKQQLPPSSKITIIESVIYLSTLCCLLSLIQSFTVNGIQDYQFQWSHNTLFLLCLITHISIFVFILSLLAFHKLVWQKSYNYDNEVKSPDPQKQKDSWINLYCDEQFFNTNDKIYKMNPNAPTGLIKKYQPKIKKQAQKQPNEFMQALLRSNKSVKDPEEKQKDKNIEKIEQKKHQQYKQQESTLKSQLSTDGGLSKISIITQQSKKLQKKASSKDNKAPKAKLKHHKSLQYLDKLLSGGKHISLVSKKTSGLEKVKERSSEKKELPQDKGSKIQKSEQKKQK